MKIIETLLKIWPTLCLIAAGIVGIIYFPPKNILAEIKLRYKIATYVMRDFQTSVSLNTKDIVIVIWTRHWAKPQYIRTMDQHLYSFAGFEPVQKIIVILHGFSDTIESSWISILKDAYMETGNFTVIAFDWKHLSQSPWYTTAAKNAEIVGASIALFLDRLVEEGASYHKMHLIGESLGAQLAAYVGYFTKGKVGRITGLDPSGPLFRYVPKKDRLDASDADFVDIIHTAGYWVGDNDLLGHVDFFPNGGLAHQPGCKNEETFDLSCSHLKSWRYFHESIKVKTSDFLAVRCNNEQSFSSGECCQKINSSNDVAIMGERVKTDIRGKFFLVTNENPPYSKKNYQSINCNKTFDFIKL